MLREVDRQHLAELGLCFSTYAQGETTLLVIEGYELPAGFEPRAVDVLIEIPSTYPDGKLDMWWVFPPVIFAQTRAEPVNAGVRQPFAGFGPDPNRQWQRFSRHPEWRPGKDDIRSYLRSLRSTMEREAQQLAA
jgi:hypothetical protein